MTTSQHRAHPGGGTSRNTVVSNVFRMVFGQHERPRVRALRTKNAHREKMILDLAALAREPQALRSFRWEFAMRSWSSL